MISCLMKVNPEFIRMIAFHTNDIVPNETQSRVYQNDSISYEMISCLMKVNPEFIRMIEMISCPMKVNPEFIRMIAFHTK